MIQIEKILFLLHFPPPVHGSSMVGKTINTSRLINENFDCRYINLLASKSIDETGKITTRKLFDFAIIWWKLLVELIRKKPQLCYFALTVTGAAFYKDVLLVLLLRIAGIKRVYHLHNKGVKKHQSNRINKWLYRFVFRNADVILLSKLLYQDIENFVPESRIHICPNGIEDMATKTDIDKKEINGTTKLLFLSNLIESKGVFVLLEACALLKEKGLLFECDFIGGEADITETSFNEKLKQLNLDKQVHYAGKKYNEEKKKAFEQADIFVFPTYYHNETFGLVNIEAMSFSLPIVSTFEGGIPDIIEDGVTGFLVPQRNAEALAEKLEVLIKNPTLCKTMGKAGREKFEKKFTLSVFEKKITKILVQVSKKK